MPGAEAERQLVERNRPVAGDVRDLQLQFCHPGAWSYHPQSRLTEVAPTGRRTMMHGAPLPPSIPIFLRAVSTSGQLDKAHELRDAPILMVPYAHRSR